MPPRRRPTEPLRRRRPQTDERKRFVVYCEGTVTEPVYFKALAALAEVRSHAVLDVRGTGYDPRRLVAEARQARRTEPGAREPRTEYWCVFDVEAPSPHPSLHDAIQTARDNGIRVAISNPCFELWLILHHAEHSRWITNQEAHSIRRKHDGSTGKQLDSSIYMHLRDAAVGRARQLTELHVSAERMLPHDNPSSGVYRLIEAVEEN